MRNKIQFIDFFIVLVLSLILSVAVSISAFAAGPEKVLTINSSYTIPSGKWARVTVNLEGSASFTIGGVLALRGTENTTLASDNYVTAHYAGTPTFKYPQIVTGAANTVPSVSSAVNTAGGLFNEAQDQKVVIAKLNLPSGTVINGSGVWRAIVEIYSR